MPPWSPTYTVPSASGEIQPPSLASSASLASSDRIKAVCHLPREHSLPALVAPLGLYRINRNVDCWTELPPRPGVNRGCHDQPLPQPEATKPCTTSLKRRSGCTSFSTAATTVRASSGARPPLHTCVCLHTSVPGRSQEKFAGLIQICARHPFPQRRRPL